MLRRRRKHSLQIKKRGKEKLKSMLKIKRNQSNRNQARRPIKKNKRIPKIKNMPRTKPQIIQLIFSFITRRTSYMMLTVAFQK